MIALTIGVILGIGAGILLVAIWAAFKVLRVAVRLLARITR